MSRTYWTESAKFDLAALDNHGWSDATVTQIGRSALAAARFLGDHPLAGPMLMSGVRKWSVRGTHFILVYRPRGDGVDVLRLLDARSDWQTIFA